MSKRKYTTTTSDKGGKFAAEDKKDSKKFMITLAIVTLALMALMYLILHGIG